MNKLIIGLMICMFMLSFASAEQDSLGTYKQGETITLLQLCGTCTYNNITSIVYPNSTHQEIDSAMTRRNAEYTYNFSQTDLLGTYLVNGFGDLDGIATPWAYEFEISADGLKPVSEATSNLTMNMLWAMLAVTLFFFIMSFRVEGFFRLLFVVLASLFLFMTLLQTQVILESTLQFYPGLISTFSTVILIAKTIISISITIIVLYSLWRAYQAFGSIRGFND